MGTKRVGMARVKSLTNENVNQLKFQYPEVIHISGTRTLLASESGATIAWSLGSAHHITLPAAEVGRRYSFIIYAGSNSNHTIITQTADKIHGKAFVAKSAAADSCNTQNVAKASGVDKVHWDGNATTHGGLAGDTCELICVEKGYWVANVLQSTTGTVGGTVAALAD